jgi:Domain of unknown function (DUF1906)
MWQGKYITVIVTASLLLLALFSGLFIYKTGFHEGKVWTTLESDDDKKASSGNMNGNNNIQNNIDNNGSNSAENNVDNTIDNNGRKDIKNNVTNNITNNVEVNVDVDAEGNVVNNVSNNISNNATNGTSNDTNNGNNSDNGNGDSENGKEGSKNSNNGDEKKDDKSSNNGKNDKEQDSKKSGFTWGIDTASLTSENFNMCVKDNFGDPGVVGRYLGNNEGASVGLTKEEVDLIKSNKDKILLIHNKLSDATGYDNGVQEGKEAINLAKELGAPEGTAIFVDIEPTFPVNAAFIQGWYDTLSSSSYAPGIYGIFDKNTDLTASFNAASKENADIKENTYIWTAAPNAGITTKNKAPEYKPQAPEGSLVIGWQYGIDAQTCNIDTNLFNNKYTDILW